MMDRYQKSIDWLGRALDVIPMGSQTFSKSHYNLPLGAAPLFVEKAEGTYIWDIDGNRYVDLVNGLMCMPLGYQDKEVNEAITQQLSKGISFSLPHRLEAQLAEILIELIPCAEMVRFGKNGTDVTSAAIRLARSITNKDHVLVGGYHGWQDWSIGTTTRNKGVPDSVQALSHKFTYNDIDSIKHLFESLSGQVAAVILEPMNIESPKDGFLDKVKQLCHLHGALLIFDEMITGFRFDLGGGQSYFGVTPDIATFGKGMANGMPISAMVGKKEFMKEMDSIFFSGTFGGETLSLAAALATINKIMSYPVLETISNTGNSLAEKVHECLTSLNIEWFSLCGHPSWKIFQIHTQDPKDTLVYRSVFIQLMAERGILITNSHNVSYPLTSDDLKCVACSYEEALTVMNEFHCQKKIHTLLKGEAVKNIFSVR